MEQGVVDSPVILVIKAPDQKYDDQTINCFLNWTVEKLKRHLSKVYPSKPVSELMILCDIFTFNALIEMVQTPLRTETCYFTSY
uniref:Uncharacterized protein n=1 Tax=Astyanax mexicanus TaxID=7994 RepID=A0A3B1ID90_ASTMX